MKRYMPRFTDGKAKVDYYPLYHMNVATDAQRKAFMAKVRAAMARFYMRKVHWLQLTTEEFATFDPEKTIVVLPIAAIEQHGPHLAVSTDTIIGQGMVDSRDRAAAGGLPVLFLPVQAVGKSNEHMRSPGTIT